MVDVESVDIDSNKIATLSRRGSEGSGLSQNKSELHNKFEKQRSLQEFFEKNVADERTSAFQRGRSKSDGAAITLPDNSDAFPSLPNNVLEKLGLYGDVSRERLNEESLEQKFTSLSLAFTIDSTTIKDRCERQRRSRDQTESNFNLEINKLKDKLTLLQPLCTDFESADLLSTLYSQVEILTKAVSLVSNAAERYGAVQHEERLTESVQLMVSYVQALKQQRDSARRQLQYTKRVLQEPLQPSTLASSTQKSFPGINKKLISKRRASTDSVNFNGQQSEQGFKLNRRTSDLSFRASLTKNRPSRLDLGMELNKIKESQDDGMKEEVCRTPETPQAVTAEPHFEASEDLIVTTAKLHCDQQLFSDFSSFVRFKLAFYVQNLNRKLANVFKKWSENGYLHVFLNSCAVLCFFISILTLVSIFLEQGYTKGPTCWLFPWLNRNK